MQLYMKIKCDKKKTTYIDECFGVCSFACNFNFWWKDIFLK